MEWTPFLLTRLILPFTSFSEDLKWNHQLASPLTAYPRLQEGIYLLHHDIDPYSGGLFHHSPLLLIVFSTIFSLTTSIAHIIWTCCDIIAAYCLIDIYRARNNIRSSRRDVLIAIVYLLSPASALSSIALSTSTLENTLYLLCLKFSCRGQASAALLTLSVLSHLFLPNILFSPPIIMLLMTSPMSSLASPKLFVADWKKAGSWIGEFSCYFALLSLVSCLVVGGFTWVPQTWGTQLMVTDLTPNPGLWWYFFTEMFDHFRPFFLVVFNIHLLIYVAPISIRFQHDPLYAIFLLQGILAMLKSYMGLADVGLFLSTLVIFPEVYPYFRQPVVTVLLHLHAALLLPLFHYLWLDQGTGNANFFYASTLVFGMANASAVIDCIWAGLRIAFGEAKEGIEIIQK